MKRIILIVSCSILSGCAQTKSIDGKSVTTIIQSDDSQRDGLFLSNNSNYIYCPDTPPEIAKSWNSNAKASIADTTGNNKVLKEKLWL